MPTTEQILKVLKNERECIARQSRPLGEMPQCRKDEDGVKLCKYCDLCLPDTEILEVYDHLIAQLETTVVKIDISKRDSERLLEKLNKAKGTVVLLPFGECGFDEPPIGVIECSTSTNLICGKRAFVKAPEYEKGDTD